MNGNTRAKVANFSQTITSTVQISSLGLSDTHFKVGYLQRFSVIRGLLPIRKSEKRVFLEIVWTSEVYLLPLQLHQPGLAFTKRNNFLSGGERSAISRTASLTYIQEVLDRSLTLFVI